MLMGCQGLEPCEVLCDPDGGLGLFGAPPLAAPLSCTPVTSAYTGDTRRSDWQDVLRAWLRPDPAHGFRCAALHPSRSGEEEGEGQLKQGAEVARGKPFGLPRVRVCVYALVD